MNSKSKHIVQLCKDYNPKGFELLIKEYSPLLLGVAKRYVGDQAKDVLQNACISIFKNIASYKEEGNFEAWIKKITINCALKEIRTNKRKLHLISPWEEKDVLNKAVDPTIFEKFNEEDILQLLKQLNVELRIAFNMYIIEGYTYKEISEMLNISESHCRMRVSRARKKLQLLLTTEKDHYEVAKS